MNSLKTYNAKLLTEAEALLTQYYEKKQEMLLKIQQEKLNEKRFLEIHSRTLNSLPEAAPLSQIIQSEPEKEVKVPVPENVTIETEEPVEAPDNVMHPAPKKSSKKPTQPNEIPESAVFEEERGIEVKDVKVEKEKQVKREESEDNSKRTRMETHINHVPEESGVSNPPDVAQPVVLGGRIAKRQRPSANEEEALASAPVSRPNELFAPSGILLNTDWNPKLKPVIKSWALSQFSLSGNQTLAINLTVPRNFRRWSLNICPTNHRDFSDLLFHFNPRYNKNRAEHMLVMNDKHGTWGAELRSPFIANDPLSAGVITLMIQIRPEGFCIFANGKFRALFRHRREIEKFSDLQLLILDKDENGMVEEAVFHKIWWGRRDPSLDALPSNIVNSLNDSSGMAMDDEDDIDSIVNRKPHIPFDVRTIVAQGLPVVDVQGIQFLEHRLEEAFQEFGLESIAIVVGKGLGYLRFSIPDVIQQICNDYQDAELRVSEAEASQTCVLKLSPMTELV